MKFKVTNKYNDIINLSHHVSKTHQQMSMKMRSAQFSPFAALTVFEESVVETSRLTENKKYLTEDEKEKLDRKIQLIEKWINDKPQVIITYFKPDNKKSGGKYIDLTGAIIKIDRNRNVIIMSNKKEIIVDDIIEIKSKLFENMI